MKKEKPIARFADWKPKKFKYQLDGETEVEARARVTKYKYQENVMVKFNEFNSGTNIDIKIGQIYLVDGKRMKLNEIRKGRYIFIKGDDIVNVPEDKLKQYVSEKRIYLDK
jgi:RNase P/RNase MRP subunit p29